MAAFTSPIDISNRGLDHAGARAITSFSDGSRNALKCAEIYDKIRQAELRRNLWRFATRKVALRPIDVTTMQLVPVAYAATVQYVVGDIVSYLGTSWICLQNTPLNGGVAPADSNGVVAPNWDNYFGPLTVDVWTAPSGIATTSNTPQPLSYHAGEIVYVAPGNGTFSAFISLVDGNSDDPLGADVWTATTNYSSGQIVKGSDNALYQSATNFNKGNDPTITVPVAAWVSGTTYADDANVYASDGHIYQSLQAGNVGNAPASSTAWWTPLGMWNGAWTTTLTPQPRATSNNWHFLRCTLQPLTIIFPMGSGPASQSQSRNAFLLPFNYLHQAPTDNKKGTVAWVGGPAGVIPDDWIFQGNFIISRTATPILVRFISDFQNVAGMDPMFCEGLAARMGFELCETLTQKPELKAACASIYKGAMGEARTINAIETGPIDPPIDDYLLVRV